MHRRWFIVFMLALAGLIPAGCATPPRADARPGRITHIVLLSLHNASLRDELIADTDAMAAQIDGIVSYACGTHLETGRATVTGDYDVALVMGFAAREDYEAYVVHPAHEALVQQWGPRLASMRAFDVLDPTP